MYYLVTFLVSFTAGFFTCWIYKNKVLASITKERDELKAVAGKFVSKI